MFAPAPDRLTPASSRDSWWPRLGAVLAALALVAIAAPSALGAPGWTVPRPVFNPAGTSVIDPQVAFAGDGSAMAAWGRSDIFTGVLESAVRDPEGTSWGAVQAVSGFNDYDMHSINLVLDRGGNAVAIWASGHMNYSGVYETTRPASGVWTEATRLSPEAFAGPGGLDVDPDGKAVAVWPGRSFYGDPVTSVVGSRVRPPGGSWGASTALAQMIVSSPDYGFFGPADVALDPAGRAVAVWARTLKDTTTLEASWRPAGGTWSTPVPVAITQQVQSVKVGIDAQGTATAVWNEGNGDFDGVNASRSSWASNVWESPASLTGPGGGANTALDLAVDDGGKAIAVWSAYGVVTTAVRPAGGSWMPRQNLSAYGGDAPVISIDPAGNAIAAWERRVDDTRSVVEARVRPQGADWTDIRTLSGPAASASDAAVAMSPRGDGLVVWTNREGGNIAVNYAAYDASGPALSGIGVPSSALVGSAVNVSLAASDRWSSVASAGWDFGDGATASGTSASHAYAAPGTYTVTARAVDALGNASTQTRQITVVAPPPPPPPVPTITFTPTGPSGTVSITPGLVVAIPGASSGSTPAPQTRGTRPVAGVKALLHVRIVVPAMRAGAKGVLSVRLDRAVRGALVRVQLRKGLRYRTIAEGRVSGRRVPVALAFASPGRYLLRIQVIETGRRTVNTVAAVVVRAR